MIEFVPHEVLVFLQHMRFICSLGSEMLLQYDSDALRVRTIVSNVGLHIYRRRNRICAGKKDRNVNLLSTKLLFNLLADKFPPANYIQENSTSLRRQKMLMH